MSTWKVLPPVPLSPASLPAPVDAEPQPELKDPEANKNAEIAIAQPTKRSALTRTFIHPS